METERLSDAWLFQRHPEEQIRRWVNHLDYSYFIRAWGGHANDDDRFVLNLHFGNRDEFLYIFGRLGIKLKWTPEGHPKPEAWRSYTGEEWLKSKSSTADFPEYEQPGHVQIGGVPCFCSVENGTVRLIFSGRDGERYEVSETDFANCKKVEKIIHSKGLADRVSRSDESSVTCISRKWYPHLFESDSGSAVRAGQRLG